MNVLVEKMRKPGLLRIKLVIGVLIMAAALCLPIGATLIDDALLARSYVFGGVLIGMLLLLLVVFLCLVRPYLLYRKFPEVQAETDGEFLYIHTKEEAKIPLEVLPWATVRVEAPSLLRKSFLRESAARLRTEKYGDIIFELPGYGMYRMRFIAHVQTSANDLISFISTRNITSEVRFMKYFH